MMPIKQALDKIKWDPRHNSEHVTIGYEDRIEHQIKEIPYTRIKTIEEGFMTILQDGKDTMIPLHRIRVIKGGDEVLWQR